MSALITPGACIVCADPSADPVCAGCLDRVRAKLSDTDGIDESEAWAIALGIVAADARAERRQRT